MRKILHFLMLLTFLFNGTPASAFNQAALDAAVQKQDTEEIKTRAEEIASCIRSQGVWRWMSTPCEGKCDFGPGDACVSALAMGCDCGTKMCFDNKTKTCK